MIVRFCLGFALFACGARHGTAVAQPRAREVVVVRAVPGLEAEAHAIADRIVERSVASGTDVVRAPAPATPASGDPVMEALVRADEAFGTLAFAPAELAVAQALARIDEGAPVTRAAIVDVWLVTSMIHGATGDAALADRAARNALAVEPALVIDPARYPPTLTARVDALRASASTRCPIALRVDPGDATLSVDGEAVATAPRELGCGTHWVRATRAGYGARTQRVDLSSETEVANVALALTIDPAAALALSGAPGTPSPALSERAAAMLGRSLVLLDLSRDDDGSRVAALGTRVVHARASSTPDEIARALLAPIDRGIDTGVAIGVGVGVGVAVLAAIAIGVAVALSPSSPPGWTATGEVVPP